MFVPLAPPHESKVVAAFQASKPAFESKFGPAKSFWPKCIEGVQLWPLLSMATMAVAGSFGFICV